MIAIIPACIAFALVPSILAYVPAVPLNDTSSLNLTDPSSAEFSWQPDNAFYKLPVSLQSIGANSTGVTHGALVHFSEQTNTSDYGSTTPWIALVSCDRNETNASDIDDIFTQARDRGALSAILYSAYSSACALNAEYTGEGFEKTIDIFATDNLFGAKLANSFFDKVGKQYYNYSPTQLNASSDTVQRSLNGNSTTPGYLMVALTAWNATRIVDAGGAGNNTTTSDPVPSDNDPAGNRHANVAFIALYSIVGVVVLLFIIVLVSGSVRAMRNPHVYGPRGTAPFYGGHSEQTRTQGLTRAILDTFPIVRYNRPSASDAHPEVKADEESGMELKDLPARSSLSADPHSDASHPSLFETRVQEKGAVATAAEIAAEGTNIDPEDMGRNTCAICVSDFENGEDLRILPCEHRYHMACIDEWLHQSRICPLCRCELSPPSEADHDDSEDGHPTEIEAHQASTSDHVSQELSSREHADKFSGFLKAIRNRRFRKKSVSSGPSSPTATSGTANDNVASTSGGTSFQETPTATEK